jgi:hypothetical protein
MRSITSPQVLSTSGNYAEAIFAGIKIAFAR